MHLQFVPRDEAIKITNKIERREENIKKKKGAAAAAVGDNELME